MLRANFPPSLDAFRNLASGAKWRPWRLSPALGPFYAGPQSSLVHGAHPLRMLQTRWPWHRLHGQGLYPAAIRSPRAAGFFFDSAQGIGPRSHCRYRNQARRFNPAGFSFGIGRALQVVDAGFQADGFEERPLEPISQTWRPTAVRTFSEGRGGYYPCRNLRVLSPRCHRPQRAGSSKDPNSGRPGTGFQRSSFNGSHSNRNLASPFLAPAHFCGLAGLKAILRCREPPDRIHPRA